MRNLLQCLQSKEACYMNERPNRRREERGSRVRDERSQNRPADYGDRPRRSSQKHKGGKVLYYGVLAILLGVLVFSSVKIISYMMEKKESEKSQQDLIDQVVTPVTPSKDNTDGNTDSSTGSEPDYISVDFTALQAKYPDVVGWIYGANTGINYPIVQTAEEGGEYYLYRDIDGSSNKNGTIFLDWRCNSDFTTQNNLLYGHNMKSGRMFAAITKYKDQSFYDAHPYLYLYTPNQLYRVNLFAGMVTPHDSDVYAYELSSDYIKQCISSSTFTSTTGTPTGNILTLSTCDYVYDNARYVVMGEMVPIDWPS